jgi:nitrous-oxide reductase
MNLLTKNTKRLLVPLLGLFITFGLSGCQSSEDSGNTNQNMAEKAFVEPGEHDEYYGLLSGGYSGQLAIYGIPSGRHIYTIPVFSEEPTNGYGYSEETKAMLNTSHGQVPWGDLHHTELSQTDGVPDGRWVFANENNTPRIARINLDNFRTEEIIELPNTSGNHASPFVTANTEYVFGHTRFAGPIGDNQDVPIDSYSENFKGALSFIKVEDDGAMDIDFQILVPGYDYDLSRAGKKASEGWAFFTTYNTEEANTLLEINASKKDKDYVLAVNWKKAAEYVRKGKAETIEEEYVRNYVDTETGIAHSETKSSVNVLDTKKINDIVYYIPTPKSPHGLNVSPDGEHIVASSKLDANIPVHSFDKMIQAIENKEFDGEIWGSPVLKYEAVLDGRVENPGLGPLHTEFDGNGNAYTTNFISSNVIKWNLDNLEVTDQEDVFYSPGHLMIPGGDSGQPWGEYMLVMNKITKDRYLPTGPEMFHSAQLFDISGEQMQLINDFPTEGEPHYAQGIPADIVKADQTQFFKLEENNHPYVTKNEDETKVVRDGKEVHVYMTAIRSHFAPDNIEGIKVGDEVYFHVTNLEQGWDVPHGFGMKGANNAELLVMPGETLTLKWQPKKAGIFPFYCTDFCSALHQEMQGYVRVSPEGSDVGISYGTGS